MEVKALIDSSGEIIAITPIYKARLGLFIWKTNVKAQKIDKLTLVTYGMVIAQFSLQNKLKKVWFFEKTLLLVDISMKIILRIAFFSLNNVHIWFTETCNLTWRNYTAAKSILTTNRVKLLNKKKFAKVVLDKNIKTFVVYIIPVF